jgi:thymidylate kinase
VDLSGPRPTLTVTDGGPGRRPGGGKGTTVVELCGLPGSGKTTLARAVHADLVARGVRCRIGDGSVSADVPLADRVRRRLVAGGRQSLAHPASTVAAAAAVLSSGQATARDNLTCLAQWLTVRDLLVVARVDPGLSLFEEGVLQRLWTLGLRGSVDVSARLWDRLPQRIRPDLVVHVDVPLETALARLEARGSRHSRVQRLEPEMRPAELVRGRRLLDSLLDGCPVPVVRLPPDATAGDLATAVLSAP